MKTIETQRLILKLVERKYVESIYEILSNKNVTKYLNMKTHKNILETKKLINDYLKEYKNKNKFPFEILDKKTMDFIGIFLIKLDLYDDDCFEFTIYLNEKYWGKGIYKEVLPYMINYAFKEIKTGNFRGFVMGKNSVSKHVLEKLNFKLEKVFRIDGIDDDIYSYLITSDDYMEKIRVEQINNEI